VSILQLPCRDRSDLVSQFLGWVRTDNDENAFEPRQESFRAQLKRVIRKFLIDLENGPGRNREARQEAVGLGKVEVADADQAFDQAWRLLLMDRALASVRTKYLLEGWVSRFEIFEKHDLTPPEDRQTLAQIAATVKLSEAGARGYLEAVRQAICAEIRRDLEGTISNPAELEEEWRFFLGL
jgi:hypothetical protein